MPYLTQCLCGVIERKLSRQRAFPTSMTKVDHSGIKPVMGVNESFQISPDKKC